MPPLAAADNIRLKKEGTSQSINPDKTSALSPGDKDKEETP
jgi:hypothetical protein